MSRQLSGMRAWLLQRISAAYMLLFLVGGLVWIGMHPITEYAQWRALVIHPPASIFGEIFVMALLLHSWIGLRDVILDYAGQRPALKLFALAALGLWLMVLGLWVIRILIGAIAA